MWDLVPPPGTEPRPPALRVQSLGHWTTREVSGVCVCVCVCVSIWDPQLVRSKDVEPADTEGDCPVLEKRVLTECP